MILLAGYAGSRQRPSRPLGGQSNFLIKLEGVSCGNDVVHVQLSMRNCRTPGRNTFMRTAYGAPQCVGGLPSFREEVQSVCIGIASHRAKRFQHRLISHSTICHAKSGSWLGDSDFLVTHFDRQIVHVAAQNRVDPLIRRHIDEPHVGSVSQTYLGLRAKDLFPAVSKED